MRWNKKSWSVAFSLALLLFCLECNCSQKIQTKKELKKGLRIANIFGIKPLNPILSIMGFSSDLVILVSDGLIDDYRGELSIATSIHTEDAKVWQIKIRNNVQFHDGTLVRASDVIHSFDLILNSDVPLHQERFRLVKELKEISPTELKVVLSKPSRTFKSYLYFPILPKKYFDQKSFNLHSFLKNPVGTGPFKVVYFKEGPREIGRARFERFDNYFKGKPKLEWIEVVPVASKDDAWAQFVQGKIDFFYAPHAETEDLRTLGKTFVSHRIIPPYGYYLMYPLNSELFESVLVRRALVHAIDREKLSKLVPSAGSTTPEWIHGNSDLSRPRPLPYNIKKAEKLLDQAGWKQTSPKAIRSRKNKKFEFTLWHMDTDMVAARTARFISKSLFDVGIRVKVYGEPFAKFFWNVRTLRELKDLAAITWSSRGDHLDRLRQHFHSSQIESGHNWTGFSNQAFDFHLDQTLHTSDETLRLKSYEKIFLILNQEIPSIFLFWRYFLIPMHKCWKDITLRSGNIFGTAWKWYCLEE